MTLIPNPIKAAIAPYMVWLKVALLAALFVGGMFTGCKWEGSNNREQIQDLTKWRQYYFDQAATNADALAEVNRQYEANKQAAKEWKERAEQADKAADKEKDKNQDLQEAFEKRLAKAKSNPDCKAIMEMNLCPTLRDY